MLKQIITTTTLIVASVAMANATEVNISSGRTNILGASDSNTNNTAETTFVITSGQLFARNNNGTSGNEKTLSASVVINGVGYKNASAEPTAALRLHANTGPVNMSGNLTIGGAEGVASTSIWSSGAGTNQNTISGNILLAANATITTVNLVNNASALLNLTGARIQLPTLNLESGTSVKFNSTGISFTSITGTGTVSFESGSKIALGAGQALTIAANAGALSFGGTTIDAYVTTDFLSSYFSGASIASVSYSNNTLTVTGGAIPEPSLFGVLAGLGALALVGTRRRRK